VPADATYSSRVLLKFAGLGTYMAVNANIVAVKLTLMFFSWETDVTLQVNSCLLLLLLLPLKHVSHCFNTWKMLLALANQERCA
jgi:hypothetical protein